MCVRVYDGCCGRDIRYNAWVRTKAFLTEEVRGGRQSNSRKQSTPVNIPSIPVDQFLLEESRTCTCGFPCVWAVLVHGMIVIPSAWLLCALLLAPCHLLPWCFLQRTNHSAGRCPTFVQICWRASMCWCCPWQRCCRWCSSSLNRSSSPLTSLAPVDDKQTTLRRR